MTDDPISQLPDGLASPELNEAADVRVSRIEQWRERADGWMLSATERLPVIGTIVEAAQREKATGGGLLAGGVAYRLFFWLVPTGLAAGAIGAIIGTKPQGEISATAGSRGIAAAVAVAERQAIDESHSARWYLLGLGLVLSIWFGLGVVRSLNVVYALAWGTKIRKVRRPPLAGALFSVVAAGLAVGASLISRGINAIGLGPIAISIAMVAVYGVAALYISMVFPHGDAPRRALLPGCLLLSVSAIGVHAFVNVYLAPKLGRSISTYGMLGAASVILLWLFVLARLITVSAFLNATLWKRQVEQQAATPGASAA